MTAAWPLDGRLQGLGTDEKDAFESYLARGPSDGRFRLLLAARRITRKLGTAIEVPEHSEAKVALHAVRLLRFADDGQPTLAKAAVR